MAKSKAGLPHNDLPRSALAYALFAAGTFAPERLLHLRGGPGLHQAQLHPRELAAVVPPGCTAEPHSPFHCLLSYRPGGGD